MCPSETGRSGADGEADSERNSPVSENREAGERPARSRHCMEGVQEASVVADRPLGPTFVKSEEGAGKAANVR